MEIRIGIQNITREITLESDLSMEDLSKVISDALAGKVLELTQTKGGRIVVPSAAIGYIEIGTEGEAEGGVRGIGTRIRFRGLFPPGRMSPGVDQVD